MISGMWAIGSVDQNNNCKIIVDNCTPYDVVTNRNYVIGLMDMSKDN